MKLCSHCRREAGCFEITYKSYRGYWGADCLFRVRGLYRGSDGQWVKKGWKIRRLNAEQAPQEFVQSSIRKQIDRAKDQAKKRAGFWHRVALECAVKRSGVEALGIFRETFLVRSLARLAVAIKYKAVNHEFLVNEAIARRFPQAQITTEVTKT